MKKVLLSAYACIPNHGSEEGTGWTYATTLSRNELEVHCLTKKDGRTSIDSILAEGFFPNLTVHYVLLPKWVDRFCNSNLIGMYFHYLYWQWSAMKLARKLDRVHRFDLVHHVTYGSIQLGSFMYKLRKPFIFGPVGGGQRAPKNMKRYFGQYWSREWMRDWVGTMLQYVNPGFYKSVAAADRLVVTNMDTFALARKLRPTRPIDRIWDAGLSPSFLPAKPTEHYPGNQLKLLWTGRMLPRKALELTIQALGKVDRAIPVTLTIVGGKGEMAEQVPHYLDRYNVRDRVNWVGHVSYQEVKEFYEQSDVFFFTSLRDSCPHQLLEAMAYSLPVVTLDLHGQSELVSEATGLRVKVTDEEQVVADLARAIEWMYHHPTERLAMGQAGYAFAQTQVWETKIRVFLDELYPSVLPKTPAYSAALKRS
ncbi:glycosyltransferase family 4 protein [Spirosoma fluviale]|uniref:Glycosyltransferase involved in cell wall bisynthesis n=1 Tax=Spirosoma fluviale TaxID=1597977 RepID=A0A286G9X3_9BACT|nr:glycosyltransferase family 4 protein [Spirosoma fluviale]SOD92026.1 Glycosyltransferase involved in cell wall bisynthesis [Spirosoma fluviale]